MQPNRINGFAHESYGTALFQVLTKRPERLAEFTNRRYAKRKPPAHIWLGASTENQETFDERHKH